MVDEGPGAAGHDEDPAWRAGWPVGSPSLCQQVVLDDPYGRVLVDEDARVVHLNPAAAHLLDRPYEDILGRRLDTFLTSAGTDVASRIFLQITADSGSDAEDVPVDVDILRPDGTRVAVEVGGHRYFDHPEHPGMYLRVRPRSRERWIEEFLTALVSGAPLAACLDPLARAFDASVPDAHTVLLYDIEGEAFDQAVGPSIDPALYASVRQAPDELLGDGAPWLEALRTDRPAFAATADLPPQLREGARRSGYQACWAFPVVVPPDDRPTSVAVMFRSRPGPPLIGQGLSVAKLSDHVALAIARNRSHRRLVQAATHDSLTELLNREELAARLGRRLARQDAQGRSPDLAVMYIDLDGFKRVNDLHGHRFGDDLLALAGRRLRGCLRAEDDMARVGGDEFVVVCYDVEDSHHVQRVADALVSAAAAPFVLNDVAVQIGASVGIAAAPRHGTTPVELIDAADRGLYLAKHGGRGCARMAPDTGTDPEGDERQTG